MSEREKNLNAEKGHITPYPTPAAATDCLEIKSIWLQISLNRILPLSHIPVIG